MDELFPPPSYFYIEELDYCLDIYLNYIIDECTRMIEQGGKQVQINSVLLLGYLLSVAKSREHNLVTCKLKSKKS